MVEPGFHPQKPYKPYSNEPGTQPIWDSLGYSKKAKIEGDLKKERENFGNLCLNNNNNQAP